MDRLKRERFRAIFDYLRRGQPAPVLNLLETVQVRCWLAGWLAEGGGGLMAFSLSVSTCGTGT